ncbi:TPA: hypothetical protein NU797_003606, partial [Acinetobacter baumannii]|nr:hypothetical protein [Acinetobacter baumannii]
GDLGLTAQAGVAPNSAKAAVSKTGPYRYFHSDHLTSIEVITDATGAVVERLSYDPWGKRRNADGTVASTVLKGSKDSHGFTSHEMLDSIGLVHMNGRVYDPQVGRFTSADPTIDGADNLQGYNRYSYVHNNPGTLLDPSGYGFLSKLVREVVRPFKQIGHALEDAVITVTDDWLGSCSSSQGNCGVTVGVTYGPNNQGYYSTDNQNINQYNNGKMTIQPYVGFGGPKNYYFVNSSYQNGELNFNGVGYNSNGMVELVPEYRIHASHLSGFSQYLFPNVQGSAARALNLDPYNNSIWQTGTDGAQYACDNNNCNMVSGNATPVTWVEEYIFGRIQYVGKAIGFYRSITTGQHESDSKVTSWISRKVWNDLSPSIQKKFMNAQQKGVVPPNGNQGIIKLSSTEPLVKDGYTHKLKILGSGGDLRIYGKQQENGHIIFDKIQGH